MVRVSIGKNVLEWAIERTTIPIDHLKEIQEFRFIEEWLKGEKQPTFKQAEALAKRAKIPFGYLLLDEPLITKPTLKDFRTFNSRKVEEYSIELEEQIYICEMRLTNYKEIAALVGESAPAISHSFHIRYNPKKAAQEVMKKLAWAPGTQIKSRSRVSLLTSALEAAGVLVMKSGIVGNDSHSSLSLDEFRGFTLMDDRYALVFVNGNDANAGQLFSLAHELGHVLLGAPGISGEPCNYKAIEKWCNQFAAEFLAPVSELCKLWVDSNDLDLYVSRANEAFGISSAVALWSLADANLIERSTVKVFLEKNEAVVRESASKGGGNFFNNLKVRYGERYIDTVTAALVDRAISSQDASRMLAVSKTETLTKLVERFQGIEMEGAA